MTTLGLGEKMERVLAIHEERMKRGGRCSCGTTLTNGECRDGHDGTRCKCCLALMRHGACPHGHHGKYCPRPCGRALVNGACPVGHTQIGGKCETCEKCGRMLIHGRCRSEHLH
jgi:hypothetical protein